LTIAAIIEKFELEPHPEGGFYTRTFAAENSAYSSILFLLTEGNFSAFHRLTSDEQWNWYYGDAVHIHEIDTSGSYCKNVLSNHDTDYRFQHIVKAGNWFASECIGKHGFALCGCTVVPAFCFDDFRLAERQLLLNQFPEHASVISRLTR